MAKTPSVGLDQNAENRFIDKYWGRVPMYLHRIQETINDNNGTGYIVDVNPEYIYIMEGWIDGTINVDNLSMELQNDIIISVDLIPFYGIIPMPDHDAMFEVLLGPPTSGSSCPIYISRNEANTGCEVYYTSEREPFLVTGQPAP
jgi:hypothetical protein